MAAPKREVGIPHLAIYYPSYGVIVCPDRSIIPCKPQQNKSEVQSDKAKIDSLLEGVTTCNCQYVWNYSTLQYDLVGTDCESVECCEGSEPGEYQGDEVTQIVEDCASGTGTSNCDLCGLCKNAAKPGVLICDKGKVKLANDYPAMGGPWTLAFNATGRVWVNLGGL